LEVYFVSHIGPRTLKRKRKKTKTYNNKNDYLQYIKFRKVCSVDPQDLQKRELKERNLIIIENKLGFMKKSSR